MYTTGVIILFTAMGNPTPLRDALLGLPFANSDVIHATDVYAARGAPSIYLEPEAPGYADWAWADGRIARAAPGRPHGSHYYLYLKNDSAVAPNPPPKGAPPTANASMLAGWSVPPSGMRSAPPLGGLSTGSIELRGDGSLHAWTIENNSPAGSAKIATSPDAAFGVKIGDANAKLLRTHPPRGLGLRDDAGIAAMRFSGATPFTRLTPLDPAFKAASDVHLFGHSRWKIGDMNASATPAIGFTLSASNPSSAPLEVAFFFGVPLSLQHGVIRSATDAVDGNISDATACFATCKHNATCDAWSYGGVCEQLSMGDDGTGIPGSRNTGAQGAASGIKGTWATGADSNCITLDRPGTHAAAGNVSLCVASEGASTPRVSFASAMSLNDLWTTFSDTGELSGELGADPVGGVAIRLAIPPGGNASATIALGWYFPLRDFMGANIGNHYAHLVPDSEGAAKRMLTTQAVADVVEWGGFASSLLNSSLPTSFGDSLLNSLHHVRSVMWDGGGRWRQWESFSCVNVDSVHNDGERHVPYLMLFPGGTKSKMRAWAAGATTRPPPGSNVGGMIQEQVLESRVCWLLCVSNLMCSHIHILIARTTHSLSYASTH